jgi:pyruvate kinase
VKKRTKIVCTIGPASESVPALTRMIRAGMNVARLNFSHGAYNHHALLIRNIRAAARKTGQSIPLLQDLQGPKIRVGDLPKEGVKLTKGERLTLSTGTSIYRSRVVPVQFKHLHRDVKKGDRILLDDGNLEVKVESIRGRNILTKVLIGGVLIAHKGITVPTASLSASAITKKDEQDLRFGLQHGVDFVALSFVRSPKDIADARRLIVRSVRPGTTPPQIIAKIEKHEALKNLDAIIEAADGIMVARGDLALETKASEVPIWQKTMIQKCLEAAKPVITATQMLDSMTRAPRPTRAEISDVANAVIDHTDATMLSQESAVGKYPVQTVRTMAEIIADTEASPLDDFVTIPPANGSAPPVLAMSAGACAVAKDVGAKAILVTTRSGFSARAVSRHRPQFPIIAVTPDASVQRQLVLSWGVEPYVYKNFRDIDRARAWGVNLIRKLRIAKRGDKIVAVSGLRSDRAGTWDEAVRVIEI